MTRGGLELEIQAAAGISGVPADTLFEAAARRALADTGGQLVIRIVDRDESADLNQRFRGRQGPTNVLSFPAGDVLLPESEAPPLGDIVICAPVVLEEARAQGKDPDAHWTHMVVHGCLHLLGYDHEAEDQAVEMEDLERNILAHLGLADPYAGET